MVVTDFKHIPGENDSEYIELLEKQLERQTAILKRAVSKVKELSEPKTGKWIPCSERLPYRFGKVLCTFIPSGGNLWTTVIIAHYSDLMGIAKPCFWVGEVGKNSFTNITEQVKAWMPLPEPYKGGE